MPLILPSRLLGSPSTQPSASSSSPRIAALTTSPLVEPSSSPFLSALAHSPRSSSRSRLRSSSKQRSISTTRSPSATASLRGSHNAQHSIPGTLSPSVAASSSTSASTTGLAAQPNPIGMSFRIESPPLVMYGKPTESTGALLSGLFTLEVLDKFEQEKFPVKTVHMAIIQEVRTVKTATLGGCSQCGVRVSELARWDILTHPSELPKAKHAYPFSHLIPGSVPASTKNSVYEVSYHLKAVAVPDNTKHQIKDVNYPGKVFQYPDFEIKLPLNIKRSIIRGPDRNSVRVFPPTEIVAQVTLPSVLFPENQFPFELVIEGVALTNENTPLRKTRWRLKKFTWRIEEVSKIKGLRCKTHEGIPFVEPKESSRSRSRSKNTPRRSVRSSPMAAAASASPAPSTLNLPPGVSTPSSSPAPSGTNSPSLEPQNGPAVPDNEEDAAFYITDTQVLASGELKSGWKTDFSNKGKVELQTTMQTPSSSLNQGSSSSNHYHLHHHHHPRTSCDVSDPTFGLTTSHVLIVELVVAEEAIVTKSNQVMPTGAARVLRMQFSVTVSERSGLGVAWDDEVPPTYGDVPLSPPEYQNVAHGGLPVLEDLTRHEIAGLDDVLASPAYQTIQSVSTPRTPAIPEHAVLGSGRLGMDDLDVADGMENLTL